MKITKSQLKQLVKEELKNIKENQPRKSRAEIEARNQRGYEKSWNNPGRTEEQAHYEMNMDQSKDAIMAMFGNDGDMAWSLIETAIHSAPGTARGMQNLWDEILGVK